MSLFIGEKEPLTHACSFKSPWHLSLHYAGLKFFTWIVQCLDGISMNHMWNKLYDNLLIKIFGQNIALLHGEHLEILRFGVLILRVFNQHAFNNSEWAKECLKAHWMGIHITKVQNLDIPSNLHEITISLDLELVKNDQELVICLPHVIHQGNIQALKARLDVYSQINK